MENNSPKSIPRRVFSIRALMLAVTVIACVLAANSYRKRLLKPDLTITPEDVAWAAGYKIWKIDLSDVGTVYGLRISVIENDGETKRWLIQSGGSAPLDTWQYPVVTICMRRESGNITGKLAYGAWAGFEVESFTNRSFSYVGTPVLNGDLYYLASDSPSVGGGREPFEKSSRKIALELMRVPD